MALICRFIVAKDFNGASSSTKRATDSRSGGQPLLLVQRAPALENGEIAPVATNRYIGIGASAALEKNIQLTS
jgi:hypothetical protein